MGLLNSCENPKEETKVDNALVIETPTNKVFLSSEINWEKLNPARGDQNPQATLVRQIKQSIQLLICLKRKSFCMQELMEK